MDQIKTIVGQPISAIVNMVIALLILSSAMVPSKATLAAPAESLCVPRYYNIVWDGWQGKLTLCFPTEASWLTSGSSRYRVRFYEGSKHTGYDHGITFYVDFNNTPTNFNDDQRFDGYHLTQQPSAQRGIAGITYWSNIPFGFYATRTKS